ncbi:retrovirus-related pol polyprotein from transposon TNT 1-94 [Tanacetum coccineum]
MTSRRMLKATSKFQNLLKIGMGASNVFRKEREQYFEIQDLKAQLQDKNIAISELKKLIEKCKGKSVDTKFDKPSVVRQPNAQRIPKPSVLGKPAPFSDSLERKYFAKKKSVLKTNESEGLSKPVTPQNLPQTAKQAVRNTNVIKPGMYRIASSTTQTRAPQLNQTSRNTNPRVSTSTGVAHKTNVSRPQPRSNQMKDKVVPNTSHVKFKKTEVEEHPRISSISNQTKSVTACNDSLNSRTSNVNAVCATCGKCVFNSNHDACVSKFLKDVNARTKKPNVVPISTRKPKSQANKSVATPHKKTVASESTITNSKSYYRMLYKKTNKAWKWWIAQQCPSAYTWVPKTKRKWVPKVRNESVTKKIVQLILFIVDSGCTKHMTGNLSLLCNFVEKYLGTVRFGNDQFAPILGYGDLVQGNITIKRVYYVEGLNHNLFSVGQFCDADLEVAFRKSTCFVRDLQGNDLLTGNRGTDLYTISLQETTSSTPICLMAKASPTQAWLWHRRLSHLNFDYINLLSKKDVVIGLPKLKYVKDQLCSSCEVSKAKRSSFKSKTVPSSKGRLNLLHMDLCGPMRVASINGKRYILDETLEVLKDFLMMIKRNLQALVISIRTDRGTEFLNKTLNAFFKEEGIEQNRTLVEAARTMLSASKDPLFFWAEAIATACYTQNISIIILTHEKTTYHVINDRKPSIKHLHIFGCTCYLTRDGENLDKMKEKGDPCILHGYSRDDIIFGSTRKSWCDDFEALMKGRFQMSSMGELTFFLGLQVKQKTDGIFISQDKYVAEMLTKFDLASVKIAITPMETKVALTKDEEAADVDVHLYRSMIGSLMYLTASRPDIMFAVCACSRFQVTPKTLHLHAVKRILKYLKGKPNLGLWYPRESSFDLEAYSDSDYAGATLDRKSTIGGCQFLGRRLISWQCKKQTIVATSTTEAEYVADASCCGQKPEESAGFAKIVDFLKGSHIRYALTHNPTIYDSLVKQFWQTATALTLANGTLELQATIDNIDYIITEASIRSKLQLADASGISMLPNTDIFEGMGNLGYPTDGTFTF